MPQADAERVQLAGKDFGPLLPARCSMRTRFKSFIASRRILTARAGLDGTHTRLGMNYGPGLRDTRNVSGPRHDGTPSHPHTITAKGARRCEGKTSSAYPLRCQRSDPGPLCTANIRPARKQPFELANVRLRRPRSFGFYELPTALLFGSSEISATSNGYLHRWAASQDLTHDGFPRRQATASGATHPGPTSPSPLVLQTK
jgi:hypothetical protein